MIVAEKLGKSLVVFLAQVAVLTTQVLGELADCVGGNDFIHVLLVPLERLVCGEESAVRQVVGDV